MDERAASPFLQPPHLGSIPPSRRTDLLLLAILLLLTVGLRAWQLTHTEVTARDSIGYIRLAWNLEHGDWLDVIRTAHQHPAYPLAVRLMSIPVRHFVADLAEAMQLSAQLVSALASVLLVIPLYFLGRELFAQRIAFWGVLLFQCLPSSGRIMADGLSEPLFLLFAASSLAFALTALRTQSVTGFALAGLMSGAAYLTRPEGSFIAAATGLVLIAQQLGYRWRRAWPVVLKCGAALTLGVFILAGPFMKLIGGLTLKDSANRVLKNTAAEKDGAPWLRPRSEAKPAVTPQLFAAWWTNSKELAEDSDRGMDARKSWAFWVMGASLAKGMFYIGMFPALLGLWIFRDRFRLVPGAAILVVVAVLLLVALYRIAVVVGYTSDRHMILITMVACFWAAAGTVVIGRWFAAWDHRPQAAGAWTTALLVVLCLGPAARTIDTLHAERAGFRQAGHWLAENAQPGDRLVDPFAWASYYAGRVFQNGETQSRHEPAVCYVVVDESPNANSHLTEEKLARALAKTGHEVRRWKAKKNEVAIYEVPETKE